MSLNTNPWFYLLSILTLLLALYKFISPPFLPLIVFVYHLLADARLCLFYKMIHGIVAVPLPDYVQPTHRVSRYCHSMTFRQIHTNRNYYKYSFFPLAIVQWNALPESVVSLQDLEAFKVAVSKLQHSKP